MSPKVAFRLPAHLNPDSSSSTAFDSTICHGQWHLIRTSNPYWKGKLNIRTECQPNGTDCFFYQTRASGPVKTMQWYTTPVKEETAMYDSRGTGLLRFVGARWEVIGWSREDVLDGSTEGKQAAWMVAYQHRTMLTPAAVNVSCRGSDTISEADMKRIDEWLKAIDDDGFQQAVEGMFAVSRG